MLNKISFKIGMLFFIFIVLVEVLLFVVLYYNLANNQVDEVMNNLLARGNTHRDVLEDHYNTSTMNHVGIMESASDFVVVITDTEGKIIVHSNPIEREMQKVIQEAIDNPIETEGKIIANDWQQDHYIASDSILFSDNEIKGHVFMFAETEKIQSLLQQMGKQFKLIGFLTLLFTIITIFILSKLITVPLIRMKRATENIYDNKSELSLDTKRKDELGVLARTINRLSEDLTQLRTERNEFLSNISHELRTPLTYIKGYADILKRRNVGKDDTEKYSAIIKDETEQLSILIKNLFDLAKVDQHKFVIIQHWIPLCAVIQSVNKKMAPAFHSKNITLDIHCPKGLEAFIDKERIQQVFINILDNAHKHSEENTRIMIDVSENNNYITIRIKDEGEGIPKEEIPKVFNRLYRVDKSRSRVSGGSGIGLAITKEIIDSHKGTIFIDSELGKGTVVTINLPKE